MNNSQVRCNITGKMFFNKSRFIFNKLAGTHKLFVFLTKVLFFFLLWLTGTSCETDLEVIKSFPEDEHMPSQSMINAEIEYTDSARLQFRLTAPEIHHYSRSAENYTEYPYGILAEFFDKNGNVESQLFSKYAIYNIDKGLWEARDSVEVINKEGEILNTEQLFWNEEEKIIYSNSYVKITRPKEVLTGEGFEADETFTSWKIKNIQGTIYIEDAQ